MGLTGQVVHYYSQPNLIALSMMTVLKVDDLERSKKTPPPSKWSRKPCIKHYEAVQTSDCVLVRSPCQVKLGFR